MQTLINAQIDTAILTGCTTSGCLNASIIDAVSYGFRTIVPKEACADRSKELHDMYLWNIGKKYAETEVAAPTRMVTSTAPSEGGPVPVRTRTAVPKDKIFDVVAAIKATRVKRPVAIGDVVLEDAAGTGVPVIATKAMA